MSLSIDDESGALLARDKRETKELNKYDEPNIDGAKEGDPVSAWNKERTQVPQSGVQSTVQRKEDFIADDILSFAWQISRGMVRTLCC